MASDDVFSTLVVWNTRTPAAVIQGGEALHRRIVGKYTIRSRLWVILFEMGFILVAYHVLCIVWILHHRIPGTEEQRLKM